MNYKARKDPKDNMAKNDYIRKDLADRWFNAKYPPDFKTNGSKYDGYRIGNEEVLFYDFAVLGYDMAFSYKGKRYYFMSDPEYVALTDESFTKEYQRFDNGNAALEQFLIEGQPIVKLVSQLEDVEPY